MRKVLTALLLILPFFLSACGAKETNAPVQIKEEKDFVESSGIVKARDTLNIMIDFPSLVEKVYVDEGQRVKKGDILVALDLRDFKLQIVNKEHELKGAQMELQNLQDKVSVQNPDFNKLQNDLKYAQDIYNKTAAEYEAQEKLYNAGAISKRELEGYKKNLDSKQKDIDDLNYSLDGIQYNGLKEIKVLKERAGSLESSLKSLQEKLNKSFVKENNIISEMENGVVYDIGYQSGDIVNSSKKVLSIMDLGGIFISANVAEEFIKDVKAGADVAIYPLADSTKTYTGKVQKIADMAIKEDGQTFIPVEISIENKDSFLLPNFNVDVEIKK